MNDQQRTWVNKEIPDLAAAMNYIAKISGIVRYSQDETFSATKISVVLDEDPPIELSRIIQESQIKSAKFDILNVTLVDMVRELRFENRDSYYE